MKFKTTQKEVKNKFSTVLNVPYCGLQHMLYYEDAVAYTCGKYGWNADIYDIGSGVAIVTGYRPFGTPVEHQVVRDYDSKARGILDAHKPFEAMSAQLNQLIKEFREEML